MTHFCRAVLAEPCQRALQIPYCRWYSTRVHFSCPVRYNDMANIKTVIALQKSLFEQADTLAREMKVSRSRLFVLALEDYVRRYQNQQLLERINQAYQDAPDATEQNRLRKMRHQHRKVVEGGW